MSVKKVTAKEILGGSAVLTGANSSLAQQVIRERMRAAQELATAAHGDQLYGDRPYIEHLFAVVRILDQFRATPDTIVAGWLHDVAEDTSVSIDQIKRDFGEHVARLVWAVTGEGEGDRQRHAASIYRKLAECPGAAIIKLADRIANVEACEAGDRHYVRYSREHAGFKEAVEARVPQGMWQRYLLALGYKNTGSGPALKI